MSVRQARTWAVAALLATSACECREQVQTVLPQLGLDTDAVDFGAAAVGDPPVERVVTVRSLTGADLELAVRIEDQAPGEAFAIASEVPAVVGPNSSLDLLLTFAPTALETYSATLVVDTNDPDADRGHRRVLLSGQGRTPQIQVAPAHLNVSAVACGVQSSSPRCVDASQKIYISNPGEVPLHLGLVRIEPADGQTEVPANLALARLLSNTTLPDGTTEVLPLRWRPSPAQAAAGPADYQAVVVIPSNDPAKPESRVTVTAHADPNAPPTACLSLKKVTRRQFHSDGTIEPEAEVSPSEYTDVSHPDEPWVRPAMMVHVTADPCSSDPEGDDLSYAWSLQRPAASHAAVTPRLTGANDPPPLRRPALAVLEPDEPGDYEIRVVVTDSLGQTASASTPVHVVPEDLRVLLSWSGTEPGADNVDLDLHLVGPVEPGTGDGLFTCRDCFFFNPAPVWRFAPFDADSPADDPRYFRDDQGTAGRLEQATLSAAPAGTTFRAAVHYYTLAGGEAQHAVSPVLRVWLKGQEQAPISPAQPLLAEGDVWFGADISFPSGGAAPTITASQERDAGVSFNYLDFVACP